MPIRPSGWMLLVILSPVLAGGDICKHTAKLQLKATVLQLKAERKVDMAICDNLVDMVARAQCKQAAKTAFKSGVQLAHARLQARLEQCGHLGKKAYDPDIDPAKFVVAVDNPLYPLPVGAIWTYEVMTSTGAQSLDVTVLPTRREILGVSCTCVHSVTVQGGVILEDRTDWIAQDVFDNVWCFGELSFTFKNVFEVSLQGSWLAGVAGAKPGAVMSGGPIPGTTFRREWALGVAEGAITVVAENRSVLIGLGLFEGCLETQESSPLDLLSVAQTYYAPGIGLIYQTRPDSGVSVELVDYCCP